MNSTDIATTFDQMQSALRREHTAKRAYDALLASMSGPGYCAATDGVRLTQGTPEAVEYAEASNEYIRLMSAHLARDAA